MSWQDHIEANPDVLNGKPAIKGTRLSVEFLLDLFAQGWTEPQVLDSYPRLRRQDLQALFAFAAYALKDQDFILPRHVA